MDLALHFIKINRYLLSQLRVKRRTVEEDYKIRFNPFFNWKIGNLKELEIKEALIFFISANERPQTLTNSSLIPFSILVDCYKKLVALRASQKPPVNIDNPSMLTKEDWLIIRDSYKKELRGQYDGVLHNIKLNEGIDYSKGRKTEEEESEAIRNPATDKYSNSEIEDTDAKTLFQELLEEFLGNMDLGDWKVLVIDVENDNYKFQAALINLHIDKENFYQVIQLLANKYPSCAFSLKTKNDKYYIEAFLNQL
jgi:subtilisin-like proprotein convertase family protein